MVAFLACATLPLPAAGIVLVLPPQTVVIEEPDFGDDPHVRYEIPSLPAHASRPWVATQPISLTFSEIRFDFDEALPFVATSDFTITVGDVYTEAHLPFGIAQTLHVAGFKGAKAADFPLKVSGITPDPDGTIRLGFDSPDIAQATTYETPVGFVHGSGLNIWSLDLSVRNLSHAGAEITLDRVSTIGDGGHIAGVLGGLPISFSMASPGDLSNVGVLALVPEPTHTNFELSTSAIAPCEDSLLCAHVVANLTGTAGVGQKDYDIPLPQPDSAAWAAKDASLIVTGGMGVRAAYRVEDVRALTSDSVALVGVFGEKLRFVGSAGETVAFAGAYTPVYCLAVPDAYPLPSVQCGDGNGLSREDQYLLGQLGWTRSTLSLSLTFESTPDLPLPGTTAFTLHDQSVDLLVRFGLDVDDDGVLNTMDNCPSAENAEQLDRGGIGTTMPDGIGDACQCGDVTGDGRVTSADAAQMRRALLLPPTATMAKPELCDVGGSDGCSTADAAIVQRALLQPATAEIAQECAPSRP